MTGAECAVYRALLDGPAYVKALARQLYMNADTVAEALLKLERAGLASSERVGKYRMAHVVTR